jgi:hypothetical protein
MKRLAFNMGGRTLEITALILIAASAIMSSIEVLLMS